MPLNPKQKEKVQEAPEKAAPNLAKKRADLGAEVAKKHFGLDRKRKYVTVGHAKLTNRSGKKTLAFGNKGEAVKILGKGTIMIKGKECVKVAVNHKFGSNWNKEGKFYKVTGYVKLSAIRKTSAPAPKLAPKPPMRLYAPNKWKKRMEAKRKKEAAARKVAAKKRKKLVPNSFKIERED